MTGMCLLNMSFLFQLLNYTPQIGMSWNGTALPITLGVLPSSP
jgi:hypothetical protein